MIIGNFFVPSTSLHLSDNHRMSQDANRKKKDKETRNYPDVKNWDHLLKITEKHYNEDCFIIRDSSVNSKLENHDYLLDSIYESSKFECKVLFGDAYGLGQIIPLAPTINWIDYVQYSSFILFYKSVYDSLLKFDKIDEKGFWYQLNLVTSQKMLMYPFVMEEVESSRGFKKDKIYKKLYTTVIPGYE